jgi:hypothetical protein
MFAVVPRPLPLLMYVGRSRLPLDESAGDEAWLDLIRFVFDPEATGRSTLDALVTNAYYRDDYLVPRSVPTPHGTRHGPYRLDCLTVESFELSDGPSAEETLSRWAEESSRATDQHHPAAIRAAEQIIAAATSIFHLKDLRETCEHEDGRLLGDFHEFVLLNRHDAILTVLVASTTLEERLPRPSATPYLP